MRCYFGLFLILAIVALTWNAFIILIDPLIFHKNLGFALTLRNWRAAVVVFVGGTGGLLLLTAWIYIEAWWRGDDQASFDDNDEDCLTEAELLVPDDEKK